MSESPGGCKDPWRCILHFDSGLSHPYVSTLMPSSYHKLFKTASAFHCHIQRNAFTNSVFRAPSTHGVAYVLTFKETSYHLSWRDARKENIDCSLYIYLLHGACCHPEFHLCLPHQSFPLFTLWRGYFFNMWMMPSPQACAMPAELNGRKQYDFAVRMFCAMSNNEFIRKAIFPPHLGMDAFPLTVVHLLSISFIFRNTVILIWPIFIQEKTKVFKNSWLILYHEAEKPDCNTFSIRVPQKERQHLIHSASAFSPWINLKCMLHMGFQWLSQALVIVKSTLPLLL